MITNIVRGKRLRVTRVGNCGLPIAGEASTIVTNGFVTVNMSKVMKDAEDLEQTNADGQVCVADRTPPELKWWEVEIEFCAVDPAVLSFFTDDPLVLDYANRPVGFRSSKRVKVTEGAALELWTGTGGDDCVVPEDDKVLAGGAGAAARYGYFLLPWLREATMGDFEIGASVTTFTITGITGAGPNWGRGPYNVVPIDEQNTPGRLLTPMGMEHLHFESTTIAPPEQTSEAKPLTLPMPYFGAEAAEKAEVSESDPVPSEELSPSDELLP